MLWTVLALTVPAQVATTGQLVGAVQDQSGAVVPGVELQLQNEDTKAVLAAAASADGGFVFVRPAGRTHLRVKVPYEPGRGNR